MPIRNQFQATVGAAWAICLILVITGCDGSASLDPAEAGVKTYVEANGGMIEAEEGHITVVWLESADLVDSDVEQFAGLPQLRELHLNYNNQLTEKTLPIAEKIPNLKVLEMTDSKMSNRVAEEFRKRHPEMSLSGPGA